MKAQDVSSGKNKDIENSVWPPFLDMLDSDPEKARSDFARFANRELTSNPPRIIYLFDPGEHPGLINDVYIHCTEDNFRRLRKYSDDGKPFAAWLHMTAHHKIYDLAKKAGLIGPKKIIDVDPGKIEDMDHRSVREDPGKTQERKQLLLLMKDMMARMDEYCQLLIRLAAREYTIEEMLQLLRLPKEKNKWLSDKLRYCRKKLKKLLKKEGVDWSFA